MQQQAVADQAAVDEHINRIAIELLHLRTADETAQTETRRRRGSRSVCQSGSRFRSRLRSPRSTRSSRIWLPNT